MGNDAQVLRKIRIGQLQGGAFTAGGLGERYGALNLYGIPLLFRSLDEIDAVRAALDPELAAGLEQAGFVTFGFIEGGFANLLSNEPISSVEDMRRKKVWVPEGDPISFMAMEALGLSPAVLPVTDVLTGLQTGLIDIAFASPVAALVLQWHTKVKYITELPDLVFDGRSSRSRRAPTRRLSAEDQQDRPRGHGPLHRRPRSRGARRQPPRGRSARELRPRRRSPSTPPTSRFGAARSRAFNRSCASGPRSMPPCSTACSRCWPSIGARIRDLASH